MKIATSLEQGKKLTEILPRESADMYWWSSNKRSYLEVMEECDFNKEDGDVRAWSISALIKLVPPYLGKFSNGIDFSVGKSMNGKWYTAQYSQCTAVKPVKVVTGKTVFDAVFNMVCWLKENGKI